MDKIVVDTHTLFFAFKYALGRKSAAPFIVMTSIINNIDKLDVAELERYINEISKCKDYGTYEDSWLKLKKDLEFELKLRNKL